MNRAIYKKFLALGLLICVLFFLAVLLSPDFNTKKGVSLIVMDMSKEELVKAYEKDNAFCLIDGDCVVQEDCYCCTGDMAVNKYNYKNVGCDKNRAICEAICPPQKLSCVGNRCELITNF
jgi:hypothetical protein